MSVTIPTRQRKLFIPLIGFNGLNGAASFGNGTQEVTEVADTTGLAGMLIDTDADAVCHFMRIPDDWDVKKNIYFRPIFVGLLADAGTVTWEVEYTPLILGSSGTMKVVAATALDTLMVSESFTSQTYPQTVAAPGVLNADKLLGYDYLMLTVSGDLGSASADEVQLVGLEIEYTIKKGPGDKI